MGNVLVQFRALSETVEAAMSDRVQQVQRGSAQSICIIVLPVYKLVCPETTVTVSVYVQVYVLYYGFCCDS